MALSLEEGADMLTYVDVSADPNVPERARLPSRTVSDALSLGFDHEGWVASVIERAPRPLITGVYVHRTRRMILETTSMPFDASALKTLLSDGTILMTETMPPENVWRMSRRGIFPPKQHRIDFEVFDVTTLAALVDKHEERVRAYEARGLTVWPEHDRRTCFAMKQRWREVAGPRMERQTKIALAMGAIVAIAVMLGGIAASRLSAQSGAFILLVLAGPPIGFAVFRSAFTSIAAVLARGAPAPPPRPPPELLTIADRVKTGFLP